MATRRNKRSHSEPVLRNTLSPENVEPFRRSLRGTCPPVRFHVGGMRVQLCKNNQHTMLIFSVPSCINELEQARFPQSTLMGMSRNDPATRHRPIRRAQLLLFWVLNPKRHIKLSAKYTTGEGACLICPDPLFEF